MKRRNVIVWAVFAAVVLLLVILLAVTARATLLPELAEEEPWEENADYYVAKYGSRPEPEPEREENTSSVTAMAVTPSPQGEGSPAGATYYGRCWITHYCPCSKCCGKSDGITASGTCATEGWTVACGGLPFGTLIEIGGHTYCVEDRGVGAMAIDIFVEDHQRALEMGAYWADVWIVG